jgi:hypothetical protein
MPVCGGRPDGPCPRNRNDSKVKWLIADVFLCDDCENYRFPNTSDNRQVDGHEAAASLIHNTASDNSSINKDTESHVHNELLCFMQPRSKVLTFDDLIKICTDFYSVNEVKASHVAMQNFVKQRLPAYKGSDEEKSRKTLTALLKQILDPLNCLPVFYAVDLSRLPPVGINHIDVAALLQELSSLRTEVRSISMLRNGIEELRTIITTPPQSSQSRDMVIQPMIVTHSGQATETQLKVVEEVEHLPSTPYHNSLSTGPAQQHTNMSSSHGYDAPTWATSNTGGQRRSIAQVVRSAVESGSLASTSALAKTRSTARTVVGKAVHNNLKSVPTKRSIHLFLSRFSPDCGESDIHDSVSAVLSSELEASWLTANDIKCTNLPTKYLSYASFHLHVSVDSPHHREVLQLLMDADSWPCGILVRRFYNNKLNE